MLTVLNDLHIGVTRSAGTTLSSARALRTHVLDMFSMLLPENDLMILGDLFDSSNIPMEDLFHTHKILCDWLTGTQHNLYLVRGNHDISKAGAMSSFDFLGALLQAFGPRVKVVKEPLLTKYGYIIPHADNQAIFNEWLTQCPETPNVYLHCNVMNNFAVNSDHSLNIDLEQIAALPCDRIICAHVHQQSRHGKVLVPGNQIPTSISDWLGSKNKFMAEYSDQQWMLTPVYEKAGNYEEMDWTELKPSDAGFIRITGTATTNQSHEVVAAISKYRNQSNAFVVSNAVKIVSDGGDATTFEEAMEKASKFDLMEVLKEYLTEKEFNIVKGL
jgi:DNA repair exonuclease SbcCD nuclease subunit